MNPKDKDWLFDVMGDTVSKISKMHNRNTEAYRVALTKALIKLVEVGEKEEVLRILAELKATLKEHGLIR